MLTGPADPVSMQIGAAVGVVVGAVADGGFLILYWMTRS
jgi:hypothetical protein